MNSNSSFRNTFLYSLTQDINKSNMIVCLLVGVLCVCWLGCCVFVGWGVVCLLVGVLCV